MEIEPFELINDFILLVFIYFKYILFTILLTIGALTLLKLRGIYIQLRVKGVKREEDQLKIIRLVLGTTYIFLALGILFNHLIYFLIWILKPLPEGLIFIIFNTYSELTGFNIEFITIDFHPIWGIFSFIAIIHFFLSLYFLMNNNHGVTIPKVQVFNLISSVAEIIIFGFTTCLPYLLIYY